MSDLKLYLQHKVIIHISSIGIDKYNTSFDMIHSTEFLIGHRSTIDQMTLVEEATILALGTG